MRKVSGWTVASFIPCLCPKADTFFRYIPSQCGWNPARHECRIGKWCGSIRNKSETWPKQQTQNFCAIIIMGEARGGTEDSSILSLGPKTVLYLPLYIIVSDTGVNYGSFLLPGRWPGGRVGDYRVEDSRLWNTLSVQDQSSPDGLLFIVLNPSLWTSVYRKIIRMHYLQFIDRREMARI